MSFTYFLNFICLACYLFGQMSQKTMKRALQRIDYSVEADALDYSTHFGAGIKAENVLALPDEEDNAAVAARLQDLNVTCLYCWELARTPIWFRCQGGLRVACAECLSADLTVKWAAHFDNYANTHPFNFSCPHCRKTGDILEAEAIGQFARNPVDDDVLSTYSSILCRCSRGCIELFSPVELVQHQIFSCPNRSVQCPFIGCPRIMPLPDLKNHISTCAHRNAKLKPAETTVPLTPFMLEVAYANRICKLPRDSISYVVCGHKNSLKLENLERDIRLYREQQPPPVNPIPVQDPFFQAWLGLNPNPHPVPNFLIPFAPVATPATSSSPTLIGMGMLSTTSSSRGSVSSVLGPRPQQICAPPRGQSASSASSDLPYQPVDVTPESLVNLRNLSARTPRNLGPRRHDSFTPILQRYSEPQPSPSQYLRDTVHSHLAYSTRQVATHTFPLQIENRNPSVRVLSLNPPAGVVLLDGQLVHASERIDVNEYNPSEYNSILLDLAIQHAHHHNLTAVIAVLHQMRAFFIVFDVRDRDDPTLVELVHTSLQNFSEYRHLRFYIGNSRDTNFIYHHIRQLLTREPTESIPTRYG